MSIAARTPVETEHKSPSPRTPDIGGRPPIRHRTGGGGGGGDNEPDGGRGPQERLYRYRPGMFFFLAADAMFFSALVASFFVLQSSTHIDPRTQQFVNTWHAVPIPRILWWNTLVLMLSTVSMELARRHMFREVDVMDEWLGLGKPAARRAFPWVTLTFLLGVAFLTGQWIAWRELQARHLIFASNQSSPLLLSAHRPARGACADGHGRSIGGADWAVCGGPAWRHGRFWLTSPPGTGMRWGYSGSSSLCCWCGSNRRWHYCEN
jgi:cytochrome c oxidase subunit 3